MTAQRGRPLSLLASLSNVQWADSVMASVWRRLICSVRCRKAGSTAPGGAPFRVAGTG
ncbi:MAG TPA: hypothetical protein VGG16_04885 [Streptosporangiaceae bacterium]